MNKIIKYYPIQVTTNRFLVETEKDFIDFVNKYNTKISLYYSLYKCSKKVNANCSCSIGIDKYHSCNGLIDKVFFDNDTFDIANILKVHEFLLKINYRHLIIFSGYKGFHLYIFTQNYENIKYSKTVLLLVQKYLINLLKLGVKDYLIIDTQVLYDVNRIVRIPNTLNLKSKLYCIPISYDDLLKGKEHILNKAKKQNFIFNYYGEIFLDMKIFDKIHNKNIQVETEKKYINMDNSIDKNVRIDINKSKILEDIPPCLQNFLLNSYTNWRQRFWIIKWFVDKGYSKQEIKEIMKEFLSLKFKLNTNQNNYEHFLQERQLDYVFKSLSLFSCSKIKSELCCPLQNIKDKCSQIIEDPIYYMDKSS